MFNFLVLSSLLLAVLIIRHHQAIDLYGQNIHTRIKKKCSGLFSFLRPDKEQNALQEELQWLGELISKLRAGISLQNILEEQSKDLQYAEERRQLCHTIVNDANFTSYSNPLAQLLQRSIREGFSCTRPLTEYRMSLENELKNLRKAFSSSAQSRVQAYTICLLPWVLISLLALSDPESFQEQTSNTYCKALWIFAIFLEGLGIFWIQKIMRKSLDPKQVLEEKGLIQFILQMQAYISAGTDIQSALSEMEKLEALAPVAEKILSALEKKSTTLSDKATLGEQQLYGLLFRSVQWGTPIREELDALLRDLQSSKASKEEEALQKLPLKLLAPLFSCIFLSAIVLLISTLIPYAEKISS